MYLLSKRKFNKEGIATYKATRELFKSHYLEVGSLCKVGAYSFDDASS
jgi:hypothetical protein